MARLLVTPHLNMARDPSIPYGQESPAANIASLVIALVSIATLSCFLTLKVLSIKSWHRLPLALWVVLAIYGDSLVFVLATEVLRNGLGINTNAAVCDAAILSCLVFYVSSKMLIYLFLVEKAHIIRINKHARMKSKLYIFNAFGMLGIYTIIVILNFIFRISRFQDGLCIIGMEKPSILPLISFDVFVNVYLTVMFLIPIRKTYTFRDVPRSQANLRLRAIATRTFVGALFTLASSVVNLSVLMALDGEPGWVCLLCCNSDILFSAIVIQWVTYHDKPSPSDAIAEPGSVRQANTSQGQREITQAKSGQDDETEDTFDIHLRQIASFQSTDPESLKFAESGSVRQGNTSQEQRETTQTKSGQDDETEVTFDVHLRQIAPFRSADPESLKFNEPSCLPSEKPDEVPIPDDKGMKA